MHECIYSEIYLTFTIYIWSDTYYLKIKHERPKRLQALGLIGLQQAGMA